MQFWHRLFQYYRHLSIKVNKYNLPNDEMKQFVQI